MDISNAAMTDSGTLFGIKQDSPNGDAMDNVINNGQVEQRESEMKDYVPGEKNNSSRSVWTKDKALEFAETLLESSLDDTEVMEVLLEIVDDLSPPDRAEFQVKVAKSIGKESRQVVKAISEYRKTVPTKIKDNYIHETFFDFPIKNLVVPLGYALAVDEVTGIPQVLKFEKNKTLVVATVAVFPYATYIPRVGATLDHPELYKLMRYDPSVKKWVMVPMVLKKSILCTSGQVSSLGDVGVSVGSANAAELAQFFQLFIDYNADRIQRVSTISKFGWVIDNSTGEKHFAPFDGNYEVVPGSGDLTEKVDSEDDFELVKEIKGSKQAAMSIISKLSSNFVFLTMLAGMFAAPVVHLVRDRLKEGIGLDLSKKTASGKTSIQTIAFNLVYGNSRPFVRSWDGATANGIWGIANKANHMPIILDDSHLIPHHLTSMPHALINGAQGDKMQVNKATNELSNRERKRIRTVVCFNGEIKLSEQTLVHNSRGLLGRVIMIHANPFPANITSEQVDDYVQQSFENCGHFRDGWLAHLATLDPQEINRQVTKICQQFTANGTPNNVYNRLAYKAAVLVWSLTVANRELNLGLTNVHKLVDFLKPHMKETTDNSDIIEEILKDIVEYTLENSANGQACHPFTNGNIRTGVYIEDKNWFLLKKETIMSIVKDRRGYEHLIAELYREGYIVQPKTVKMDFNTFSGGRTSMSGIVFQKNIIDNKTGLFSDRATLDVDGPDPEFVIARTEAELVAAFNKKGSKGRIISIRNGNFKQGSKKGKV